ncbi:hypothetical protein FNW25_17295 [Flavobacterium franklandianum]|nr:hypothetical protein [Flavobacterium franklandianum]TRX15816.1 hypothetical protein FNW25_17295 [Flavobacterium franklandianum]
MKQCEVPKLHRFLQPDNYVQQPFNTQNYNWNKVITGAGKEIFSAYTGAFAYNYYKTGDFNKSLENSFDPTMIIQSAISGAVGGVFEYKVEKSNLSISEQTKNDALKFKNNLEFQVNPYYYNSTFVIPKFPMQNTTVIPLNF